MILMAWDHVSMYWMQIHGGGEGLYTIRDPDLTPGLFLARFISHWCAPTFVFLSGVSIALSTISRKRKGYSESEITFHLIKRGLLLLLFEALIVSPAFDLPRLYFGVIAAIGVSLIILSVARRLPSTVILGASLLILLNHQWIHLNLPMETAWGHYLTRVIIEPGLEWPPYFSLYPFVPWLGVMGLGYCFGSWITQNNGFEIKQLQKTFFVTGIASILAFFLVRLFNGYGNLVRRWSNNPLDWFFLSKYPPSQAFLLWTLGGTCIFMVVGILVTRRDWTDKPIIQQIHTFGRVPLFFYLTHLWLYRLRLPGVEVPFHLNLIETIGVWTVGLCVLWLFCSRYEELKKQYPRFLQYI